NRTGCCAGLSSNVLQPLRLTRPRRAGHSSHCLARLFYAHCLPAASGFRLPASGRRMTAAKFVVHGGHRLSGVIRPAGNKNAALPIVAASLLSEHPVTLGNVPRIRDVETLIDLIRSLGVAA